MVRCIWPGVSRAAGQLGLFGPGQGVGVLAHCFESFRSAARSAVATSGCSPSAPVSAASASTAAIAASASRADQPRLTRPVATWSRQDAAALRTGANPLPAADHP